MNAVEEWLTSVVEFEKGVKAWECTRKPDNDMKEVIKIAREMLKDKMKTLWENQNENQDVGNIR